MRRINWFEKIKLVCTSSRQLVPVQEILHWIKINWTSSKSYWTWTTTYIYFVYSKNGIYFLSLAFYSLACPSVATPHKFHTSFWQVFDKFDGSHDKNFFLPSSPMPIFGWCDWLFGNQQPSNLLETCQKLVENLCGVATVGRARL